MSSRNDDGAIKALGKSQRIAFDDLEEVGPGAVGRQGRPVEQIARDLNDLPLARGAAEKKLALAARSLTENSRPRVL